MSASTLNEGSAEQALQRETVATTDTPCRPPNTAPPPELKAAGSWRCNEALVVIDAARRLPQ